MKKSVPYGGRSQRLATGMDGTDRLRRGPEHKMDRPASYITNQHGVRPNSFGLQGIGIIIDLSLYAAERAS
jgi:hypothetical protein